MEADSLANILPNLFLGLLAEKIPATSPCMGEEHFSSFLAFFLPCGPTGQLVCFSSSLDQHCPTNTTDLRSRDKRKPITTVLRSGQGHMSVDDSAEEFISIHDPGRERLLVLSCGLPLHPLKIPFFAALGDDREVLPQFSTHQPPNVFLTET